MVNRLLIGVVSLLLIVSCTDTQEGFIGEWEGITERINDNGNLVEVEISCTVKSVSSIKRNLELKVGGAEYRFEAIENVDELIYEEKALNSDSTIIFYISGNASIIRDTILQFDHELYALKNGALLNSNREILEMTRK